MSNTFALANFLQISRNNSFVGSKGKILNRLTSLAWEASVRNWFAERDSKLSSEKSPQATHLELWYVNSYGSVKPVEICHLPEFY